MYARSGLMRSDASRSNYLRQELTITIGGSGLHVIHESLTIHDYQHNTPNTAMFTVIDARPTEGAEIVITLNGVRIFAGNVVRVTEAIAVQNPSNPRNILWHVEAIDWTWQLNQRLITARFLTAAAESIVWSLVTNYGPPGYVAAAQTGLPVIDEITFTNETFINALSRLAQRIGGYTKVDYFKNVLMWITEQDPPPAPITWDLRSFKSMTYARDLSQIITRALVEGGGVNALAPVAPGSTRIPVDSVVWYSEGGGYVVSGPQRIAYTGVSPGGSGAFVGPGITPTAGPSIGVTVGASAVEPGTHQYAYTWVTAGGETLPSPASSVVVGGGITAPGKPLIGTHTHAQASNLTIGQTYPYAVAWSYVDSDSDFSQVSALGPREDKVCVPQQGPNLPTPVPGCTMGIGPQNLTGYLDPTAKRQLWFRLVGGTWRLVVAHPAAGWRDYYDGKADWEIQNNATHPAPSTGNIFTSRPTIAGIAPGPSGVTSRKLYRTAANSPALKFHGTIPDNTQTAVPGYDNVPDASLGAAAPTVDTAGLPSQANKIIPSGSTEIVVTSVAPFNATGGTVEVAGQYVRHTGRSATTLTGIPATGDGALVSSIAYGTPITAVPELIGIPPPPNAAAIAWPIEQGDPVNVLIVVDDLPAQTALAAMLGGGASGVQESYKQDRRLSIAEATAEAYALLARSKDPVVTVRYRTTDPATVSGALVTITLGAPVHVVGTFRIQDMTLSGFTADGRKGPNYDVIASSQRFTFEDLIRQMRK